MYEQYYKNGFVSSPEDKAKVELALYKAEALPSLEHEPLELVERTSCCISYTW